MPVPASATQPAHSLAKVQLPELVLVHGWGLHGGVWQAVLPHLQPYFRVTVVNLPGYGARADANSTGRLAMESLLAAAPASAIWCGWSLGGLLALALAARHPDRVRGLAVIAGTPCFVQRPDWRDAMPAGDFFFFEQHLERNVSRCLNRFLSLQCQGSSGMKADLRYLQARLAEAPLPSRAVLRAGLDQLAGADLRPALANLMTPSLWLLGGHDALVPAGVGARLEQLSTRVRTVCIDEAAHVPQVSHPQAVAAALAAFAHGLSR